jgi:hypothetical protein
MAAVMGTVRVSSFLVKGVDVDVDVGGCSHPHLCHLGRLSSLCCCLSWCVTHDPKRKKVAFGAVVAVVPR